MKINIEEFYKKRLVEERKLEPIEPYPISICTPFYNSEAFLNTYLKWLTLLDYPRDITSLYFTVQGKDSTFDTLKRFKDMFSDEYKKIKFKRIKQVRHGELPHVRNVCQCRNILTKWSRPDPVFFIDHDNFPAPYSIKRLQECHQLGADIAGGIYVFYQRNENKPRDTGRVGFTAFFIENDQYYHASLDRGGYVGYFSAYIIGRRVWCTATAMGTTLIKREVLNEVKFEVPWGTAYTDDTWFCMKAKEKGFKPMADFGLFVPHWGFQVHLQEVKGGLAKFEVVVQEDMYARRRKMYVDGVYIW